MYSHTSLARLTCLAIIPATSTAAECSRAELIYLSQAGLSVTEAISWCKQSGNTQPQPENTSRKQGPIGAATQIAAQNSAPHSSTIPIAGQSKPVAPASAEPPITTATQEKTTPDKNDTKTNGNGFFGPGQWGAGLAVMRNSDKVINDASIQNGIVRANNESRVTTELLMTRNFYFHKKDDQGRRICSAADWGLSSDLCLGLFVGVGLSASGGGSSGNQLIDMVGAGILIGFGRLSDDMPFTKAHNIGIGWGRRLNVKTLGDGFHKNSPSPDGETQVRYKSVDMNAPFLFYTYNFTQN